MKRTIAIVAGAVAVIALGLGLGLGLGLQPAGSQDALQLSVLPFPGTPDASPTSQIGFLGVAPSDITSVTVQGSQSGVHSGTLSALADDRGSAFVAGQPFSEGETVSVSATLGSKQAADAIGSSGNRSIGFIFTVAVAPQSTTTTSTTQGTSASAAGQSTGQSTGQSSTTSTTQEAAATQSFRSAPDLTPPVITVTTPDADPSSGYIFADAQFAPQNGPMILDPSGNLVWFKPLADNLWAMDVRVQSYAGSPVLTWWQGSVSKEGHGSGDGMIVDSSYQPVATVKAGEGYSADVHEFKLSSNGTAYMTIYQSAQADLTSVGGPANGTVVDGIVQEVDIKTGQVLWEWHALGHVPLTASYADKPDSSTPYDYFHINSICETTDGNLLVSSRNTWAIYEIDRKTGAILWQLGGKGGSIRIGEGVQFEWQHDALELPDGTITIFDNASSPPEEDQSRALHIAVDVPSQTSTLLTAFSHAPGLLAGSQGNVQILANGNFFVGWGDRGAVSEFSPDGKTVFDATLAPPSQTYRAYRSSWVGRPTQPPAMAVSAGGGNSLTVYASWNGATGVSSWQLLAGDSPDSLAPITSAQSTGFETAISATTALQYLEVQALDSSGAVLGTSAPQQR